MSDSNELALTSQAVVPQEESLLSVIAKVASDPRGANVEVMERLLAMQERINAEAKRTAYFAAMARVAPKLPQINKRGRIEVNNVVRSRYALLEDIDAAIRPILAEEGLSLSFDSTPVANLIRVSCRCSHREGYSEVKAIDLPPDKSGGKNEVQAMISTVSYGRKALTKMFFNLVEAGEDDDGMGGSKPISQEDADKLREKLIALNGNQKAFLEKVMGVKTFEEILQRDLDKANTALDAKARNARS